MSWKCGLHSSQLSTVLHLVVCCGVVCSELGTLEWTYQ